jgi:glycosyltransferase involved in cell wall biosynthesis
VRILQIITTIDVGGAERHLLSLCSGLVSRGHRVDVGFLKGNGALRGEFERIGVNTERFALESPADVLSCVRQLHRHLKGHRYSVVHTHLLKANFVGGIAGRLAGIRCVVASKHNDEPQLRKPWIAQLHKHSSRLDRRIICSSRHILDHMVRFGGVEASRCDVVYYGIEAARGEDDRAIDLRAEVGADRPTFLIACVARLIPRKGHRHLLEAMSKVVALHGDVRLLVVGAGSIREDLENRCRRGGLQEYVVFTGERMDVPAILHDVDVLVLPSEAEGLGLVLLEAMAAGKPVVASAVGGIPEIVIDGETGFLVQPGSPGALAERICSLLEDPQLAARMGEHGLQRQRRMFSADSMVERILDVYRRAGAEENG